jgi:SHS2 domain-containing protein
MTNGTIRAADPPYRIFDHTADLGLEVYGTDERDLFRNAAHALFDILTDRGRVRGREERQIAVEGADREELLVNFLREALSLYNSEGWLVNECAIREMDDCHLRATVTGEPFDPGRHAMNREIKAVTYHQAHIERTARGWTGRVICDV